MARCEVCFVGSVPMANAREVFSTLGSRFGQHARRLPDGETNERLQWVAWQERVFVDHPDMEVAPPEAESHKRLGQPYDSRSASAGCG